ncbi:tight adherence pilus pseudopilin TadF [Vibrio hippocampi]|uniref:Membrane associated secretion system protein n=1 Tax=Vibrio hippocampi TaxID=654686 RepID=A0ABM8ZLU8_9VIBR|nr:tight adherence pilus pseudopilin TadF [Vibrio hippocampi]CAH0529502.1 hypothetical protein VHP8226_03256 [Vibrio hippocampi]
MRIARQKGAFAIELSIVLVVLMSIYLFMTDISHKLLVQSQLDRISFALVNVLKERTRYYADRDNLSEQDRDDMHAIASRMLNIDASQLAIRIEALHNQSAYESFTSERFDSLGCSAQLLSNKTALVPTENGTVYSLYQVTLCEQRDSWYDNFWGRDATDTFTITSTSVVAGR